MSTGQTWDVVAIGKLVDGDTVRLCRNRTTQLGDHWYRICDANPDGTARSVTIKLAKVKLPKPGEPDYNAARYDLTAWVQHIAAQPLRVTCYDDPAGEDRILGDLIDADGNSASQWMMRERGWPAYQKKGAK